MHPKQIKCPNCNKTLTHYIEGHAVYEQKCDRCKAIVKIYSAGQTVVCAEGRTMLG